MVEQPTARKRKYPSLASGSPPSTLSSVAVYILTAMTTSPDKVGYDWIPLRILAVPWSAMAAQLLFAWVSD